jgi:hypothetical protein
VVVAVGVVVVETYPADCGSHQFHRSGLAFHHCSVSRTTDTGTFACALAARTSPGQTGGDPCSIVNTRLHGSLHT